MMIEDKTPILSITEEPIRAIAGDAIADQLAPLQLQLDILTRELKTLKEESPNKILTTRDVMSRLNMSESTVLNLLQKGLMPGKKVASQWRIREDEFDKWMVDYN